MTTDFSGQQAEDTSNRPQEPVDERQSSDQRAPHRVTAGSEQPPTTADSPDENMAGNATSAAAPAQNQQQAPDGYQEGTAGAPGGYQEGTAGAPGGYQQDTPDRVESGSEAPQPRADESGGFGATRGDATDGAQHSLIGDASDYTRRWESIQVGFVDDPRSAVQEAETLVSDVMREVAAIFQRQRQQLEEQWSGGNQASTDDLRMAFQRYRDFFQRLLQV